MGTGRACVAALLMIFVFSACAAQAPTDEPEAPRVAETTEEVTVEDFVADADTICHASAETIQANNERYEEDSTEDEILRIEEELVRLVGERLENLERLEPPAEVEDEFEDYLQLRRDALEVLEERLVAIEEGNDKARDRLAARSEGLQAEFNELGQDIGFFACANRLPTTDAREVEANLVEFFTIPSAPVCRKLGTRSLLQFFDSAEECGRNILPSNKVTVRDIEGVADVRASAVVTASAYPNEKLAVELVYEGGTYRINGYAPE